MATNQAKSEDEQTICTKVPCTDVWACSRLEEVGDEDHVWERYYTDVGPEAVAEDVLARFTAEWAASLGAQA